MTLRAGVAGQLRLNSFGTVSERERYTPVVELGAMKASRHVLSFFRIRFFTSCRLAAMRICSISSVLSRCLEQLLCERREHLESTELAATLKSMSEPMERTEPGSSRLLERARCGVTMIPSFPKAERAGENEGCLL